MSDSTELNIEPRLSTKVFIEESKKGFLQVMDFNIHPTIESAIKVLKETYENHTIAGIEDKDGYKAAKEGVQYLIKVRTGTEKKTKEINSIAKEFEAAIKTEAGKIVDEAHKLQKSLEAKIKVIDDLKQAEKDKEKKALLDRYKKRVDSIFAIGFKMDADGFVLCDASGKQFERIFSSQINDADNERWDIYYANQVNTSNKIKADAEAKEKADAESTKEAEALKIANAAKEKEIEELKAKLAALTNPVAAPIANQDTSEQREEDESEEVRESPSHQQEFEKGGVVEPNTNTEAPATIELKGTIPAQTPKVADSPMLGPLADAYMIYHKANRLKDYELVQKNFIRGGNCIVNAVIDYLTNVPPTARPAMIEHIKTFKLPLDEKANG